MTTAHSADAIAPPLGRQRARSLAAARRRSAFVRRLRLALLVALGLIALNALVQILLNDAGIAEAPEVPTGELERIIHPRFTGRDEDGTPFVVTAESAVRRPGGVVGLTELDQPRLDYALLGDTGQTSEVLARSGYYDPQARTLLLQDEVNFATQSGYRFETRRATLHLEDSRVEGEVPVFGVTDWGAIRAGGFVVQEDGAHIVFTDGVRTRIYADQSADAGDRENGQ